MKILNLPNILTLTRIAVIPIILKPSLWENLPFSELRIIMYPIDALSNEGEREKANHMVAREVSSLLKN